MDERFVSRLLPRLAQRTAWVLGAAFFLVPVAPAAEIHLKNGDILDGKPVPIQALTRVEIEREHANDNHFYPILMVHTGIKRYFVPEKQVLHIDRAGGMLNLEEYTIDQKFGARRQMLRSLGGIKVDGDFDEYGRRKISFRLGSEMKDVVQGITKINPRYVTVSAMTDYNWEHAISTSSIKPETLNTVLRKRIDDKNPQERMGLAVFYMKAGLFVEAAQELDSIVRDFPELKDTAEKTITQLRSVQAQRLLVDLRRRRDTGQYQLAALALKNFPRKDMSADVLKELVEMEEELKSHRNLLEHVGLSLTMLQRSITDEAKQTMLESMRSALRDEVDAFGLKRFDAFLKLENDDSLSAEQKLALAYSGWVLGSAHAVTDLDQTLRYWQARHLIEEYLIARDTVLQRELLAKLRDMEGITPDVVARMLIGLRPVVETPGIEPGVPQRIEIEDADPGTPVAYHVLLPHEYTPNRAYPIIVALHPAERGPQAELEWWGGNETEPGQAQRHGYIVIAPEYIDEKLSEYDYAATSHYITLKALRDARKRFHINSDKVFLSGHGMGGDAAFDIGMSHPHEFAGVIPISALARHYCKWYWENAKQVPWYLVSGELCRNSLIDPDHSAVLGRMLRYGHEVDITYAEYIGRGYEHYYEEIHDLFDWMDRLERKKALKEVEAKVLRPLDNRFYWIKAEELPPNVLQAVVITTGNQRVKAIPMKLNGKILDGSTDYTAITIDSGAKRHILELSPDLIDYNKRLKIRHRSQKFNDFPEPSIENMLDDFRERGDRQKLVWTRIVIE